MPENLKEAFFEVVKQIGEKVSTEPKNPDMKKKQPEVPKPDIDPEPEPEKSDFSCPKCKTNFTCQLDLASHMTNTNCLPVSNLGTIVKCLLCDFEVGSVLQYKCHLMVHYATNVENEVKETFEKVKGVCKECDPNGRPMEFQDFASHLALDHDKIINVVASDVRTHLSLAFPGSDAIIG